MTKQLLKLPPFKEITDKLEQRKDKKIEIQNALNRLEFYEDKDVRIVLNGLFELITEWE